MPPWLPSTLLTRHIITRDDNNFAAVRSQWQNPTDILTVLMIIGGDIVQRAIAQLAGSGPFGFAPVAFSFGWVSYSLNTILSTIGDNHLIPPTDCPSVLVSATTGHVRNNRSWVLGRLIRDHRPCEMPGYVKDRGLTITVYETVPHRTPGSPDRDWVYYVALATILVQVGVAVIPGALHGNWTILIVTMGGTVLAGSGAAIPKLAAEKWAGRRLKEGKREVVSLTRGNGSDAVMVIISDGVGIKLEDLAAAREVHSRGTIAIACALAALWVVHLMTVQGSESDGWYLLAVGSLGMIQNVIAAGARRYPSALGIHLKEIETIYNQKVFQALVQLEELEESRTRGVGLSLLPVFFPGTLSRHEEQWRQGKIADYAENRQALDAEKSPRTLDDADKADHKRDLS